ncbi:MAG: DUF4280 domain-containing protein [Holosporaceae bacterium]
MGSQVLTLGTMLSCTQSLIPKMPTPLGVLPLPRTFTAKRPTAIKIDMIPFVNIVPFGMCKSPTNPMVIAAKAASLGAINFAPCIPAPMGPWKKFSKTVKAMKNNVLTMDSCLNCMWNGKITPVAPPQPTVLAG